jgi:hypothetical protein
MKNNTETKPVETLYTKQQLEAGKMYVRISDIAYIYCGYDNDRRQFFKDAAGYFMEVETEHLFHNQYNTKTQRILDSMVSEVVGDVRAQWCSNKYTGAMVRIGEEGKYIAEEKAKAHKCVGCFWFQRKLKSRNETTNKTGETETRTEVTEYEKVCEFSKKTSSKTDCTFLEGAEAGFNYFTPENTFFLKYPNGLPQLNKGQEQVLSIHKNCPKIGTYYLECFPSLNYYRAYNSRKTINFKFDGKNYFVANGIGFEQRKSLDVIDKVQAGILKALQNYPLTPEKDTF